MGMGDVEVKRRIARRYGKSRFTAIRVVKSNLLGGLAEVSAKQFTQCCSGGDVCVSIMVESKAVGTGEFVGGKSGLPGDWRQALRIMG